MRQVEFLRKTEEKFFRGLRIPAPLDLFMRIPENLCWPEGFVGSIGKHYLMSFNRFVFGAVVRLARALINHQGARLVGGSGDGAASLAPLDISDSGPSYRH